MPALSFNLILATLCLAVVGPAIALAVVAFERPALSALPDLHTQIGTLKPIKPHIYEGVAPVICGNHRREPVDCDRLSATAAGIGVMGFSPRTLCKLAPKLSDDVVCVEDLGVRWRFPGP